MNHPARPASSRLFAVTFVCLGTGLALLAAGPLNPPSGAVSSSGKTLSEVEPRVAISPINTPGAASCSYRITQPGSYYLTGNIQGVNGKNGIEITSGNVTIDLNGFELTGTQTGNSSGIITVGTNLSDIVVINGNVSTWGGSGIDVATSQAIRCTFRNVHTNNNVVSGIKFFDECVIKSCSASYNNHIGLDGFAAARITGCTVSHNSNGGIDLTSNCIVTGCIASANPARGIHVIDHCLVTECIAAANDESGIEVGAGCRVIGNDCSGNGFVTNAAGIRASSGSHIESNTCESNAIGFQALGLRNVLVRNQSRANTIAWALAANNIFGPIIDRQAPASAAVNGVSATSTLGSTDANANYTN